MSPMCENHVWGDEESEEKSPREGKTRFVRTQLGLGVRGGGFESTAREEPAGLVGAMGVCPRRGGTTQREAPPRTDGDSPRL